MVGTGDQFIFQRVGKGTMTHIMQQDRDPCALFFGR